MNHLLSKTVLAGVAILCASSAHASSLLLDFPTADQLLTVNTSSFVVGWKFQTSVSLDINGIGFFNISNHGLIGSHEVGLFDSSGTLLFFGTVQASSVNLNVPSASPAGTWAFDSFPNAFATIQPGIYTVAATVSSATDNFFTAQSVTTIPGVTFLADEQGPASGTDLLMPTTTLGNQGYFGPNLLISAVGTATTPEPGSIALLGMGLALVCLKRRQSS